MDCGNASPCVLLSGILPLYFLRDLVTFVLGTMVDMFGRSLFSGRARYPAGGIGSKERGGSLGTRDRICPPHPYGCQSNLLAPPQHLQTEALGTLIHIDLF